MFERLWIALGIKKRPAAPVRLRGQSGTLRPAMASVPVQQAWSAAKGHQPTRATQSKVMAKAPNQTPRRRRDDDDDGFPATQISSFSDYGGRSSQRRAEPDDERDIPIPFRSGGGGLYGGGGASGGWDEPSRQSLQCDEPSRTATSSWTSTSSASASSSCRSDDDRGGSSSSFDSGSDSSSPSSD